MPKVHHNHRNSVELQIIYIKDNITRKNLKNKFKNQNLTPKRKTINVNYASRSSGNPNDDMHYLRSIFYKQHRIQPLLGKAKANSP